MIFYFSGTGNSLYVAQKLSGEINERLVSIADEMNNKHVFEYTLAEGEKVGFVYPVYAWQPPGMVIDFIHKLKLNNYRNNYIFSVSTCGDDEGYTTGILKKALAAKGLKLNSGFTVAMPNNYIIMFDVDPQDAAQKKLADADIFLKEIKSVVAQEQDGVFKVRKGFLPFTKTYIINPLFQKFGVNAKKFYATDSCTQCGLCARVCNTCNITVHKKPVWGSNCIQCMACIHRCPQQAVQYGKITVKKGRYVNPNCDFSVTDKTGGIK